MNAFERDMRKLANIERMKTRADRIFTRAVVSGDRRKYKRADRVYFQSIRVFEIRNARFKANGCRSPRP